MIARSLHPIEDAFLGLAVGDALGVPVEFNHRDTLAQQPVTGMRAYGTHHQPAGTWSDDSSLAFCTAEALCQGYQLELIGQLFVAWYQKGYWTPHGKVFDIGISTAEALNKINQGTQAKHAGNTSEKSNGNGSLMRILPLVFYLRDKDIHTRWDIVAEVSGITHAHIRSILSCFIYVEYVLELLKGQDKLAAFQAMQTTVSQLLRIRPLLDIHEWSHFGRVLPLLNSSSRPLFECSRHEIASSGYVIDTLEASLWCFLTTDNYADAVLLAVNLGSDTDTTGCVTGGLAGLYYGQEAIPEAWLQTLARKEDIVDLARRLSQYLQRP